MQSKRLFELIFLSYSQQLSVLCVVCTYVQEKVFEKVIRKKAKVKTDTVNLFIKVLSKRI